MFVLVLVHIDIASISSYSEVNRQPMSTWLIEKTLQLPTLFPIIAYLCGQWGAWLSDVWWNWRSWRWKCEWGVEEDIIEEADVSRATNTALEGVWSGLHYDADEEYDEDENDSGEGEEENVTEDEVAEGDYGHCDDEEHTLSALDMLGEDFERESVANGKFPYAILL